MRFSEWKSIKDGYLLNLISITFITTTKHTMPDTEDTIIKKIIEKKNTLQYQMSWKNKYRLPLLQSVS